ncbi:MAG: hypothetical protein CL521_04005 [Actinobacteria bacterium]|nr:hypothetical protein [Actinomycetota bacterium]
MKETVLEVNFLLLFILLSHLEILLNRITLMFVSRYLCLIVVLVPTITLAQVGFQDDGFADQQFLDNSDQFSSEQGVRMTGDRGNKEAENPSLLPTSVLDQEMKRPAQDVKSSEEEEVSRPSSPNLTFSRLAKRMQKSNREPQAQRRRTPSRKKFSFSSMANQLEKD